MKSKTKPKKFQITVNLGDLSKILSALQAEQATRTRYSRTCDDPGIRAANKFLADEYAELIKRLREAKES